MLIKINMFCGDHRRVGQSKKTAALQSKVASQIEELLVDDVVISEFSLISVDALDVNAYQKELRNDYIINQELSNLALKCGRFLALANAALITTKHVDFNKHIKSKNKAKSEELP